MDATVQHPYRSFPPRQFWTKAVARDFNPSTVGDYPIPLIMPTDKVVTAGSCFAANLIPYLEKFGLHYLKTEYTNPIYRRVPKENLSYDKFSAAYGNIYTVRQLYQLLLRSLGEFQPAEDCWIVDGKYIDPFRPALKYVARSEVEFKAVTAAHLRAVKRALTECNTFIFTLGLTEGWASTYDGAVFPACPGTIAGQFDGKKHAFVNFTIDEVVTDLRAFVSGIRALNPSLRIILTVSPVPLVATGEAKHVLSATIYSKSVLRVAAETITREFENAYYFPAYEIVTGPQAPSTFFEADCRNVSEQAVEVVMSAFLAACKSENYTRSTHSHSLPPAGVNVADLSSLYANLECEEAAQER